MCVVCLFVFCVCVLVLWSCFVGCVLCIVCLWLCCVLRSGTVQCDPALAVVRSAAEEKEKEKEKEKEEKTI